MSPGKMEKKMLDVTKRKKTFVHPLSDIVIEYLKKHKAIDATDLQCLLGCSLLRPQKGVKAYRIVAVDILGCMADGGMISQIKKWDNPRKKEDGGAKFTLPGGKLFTGKEG